MILHDFDPFIGEHCETTTTGSLLKHLGHELSEPMLFGLGEGLSFIYWKMKSMEMPFFGGRVKPEILTQNLCRNLNLQLHVAETTSKRKAWENVANLIEKHQPVGLKLDCFHLEYFSAKIHFAGHYVLCYGFDEETVFLIDTAPQGGRVTTSRSSLERARCERGPMSSRCLSYHISGNADLSSLEAPILSAVRANADEYLNPPISNVAYRGIVKASKQITKWFQESDHPQRDFQATAAMMERAGTGGALFRNFYRDFLEEAFEVTGKGFLKAGQEKFVTIASRWTAIAAEFHAAGETGNLSHIESAREMLVEVSGLEKTAMEGLRESRS